MPEVAGNAAVLIDPFSITSIADAMQKVASDAAFREKLIGDGRKQMEQFSWERTAESLWKCVEKTAVTEKK
jgi:glycosyltransferase involved in cell wall biosynthesis